MRILGIIVILILISFACTDNDTIKPSVWEKIDSHSQYGFSDIEFLNNEFGVACGPLGTLFKTDNEGKDWMSLDIGIKYSLMKVFILNENEFYTSRKGLYKTNNGGGYFTEIGNLSSFGATIFEIHFFDTNNGLIFKSGRVYKTNDGGENWVEVYEGGFCDIMQFNSRNIGYISGGASWDGMSYGELHKTLDGGNTWTNLGGQKEIYEWEIMSMDFIDDNTGYISNYNKEFYITQNGGSSWQLLSNSLPSIFREILFFSKDEGYGMSSCSIFKTIDGGISWNEEYTDSTKIFTSITATPDGTLFVATTTNIILKKEK